MGNIERYGIAGRAAGNAVLQHGRDGARLRPASDAFLLSRIARAVVDALDDHDQGAVVLSDEERELAASALEFASTYAPEPSLAADALAARLRVGGDSDG